ncbi:hypothetical protein [Paenibacillus sp. Soil766]|nr:hypothetical protein [Paenibacillus sp. Soil766]
MKKRPYFELPASSRLVDQGFFTVFSLAVPHAKVNEKRTIIGVSV